MNEDFGDIRTELRRWRVSTPLPRQFKGEVWRRIAAAKRPPLWQAATEWLDARLLRPAPAFAYIALLVILGLTAGAWKGDIAAGQKRESLMAQYVQSVDPYQGGR